MKKNKLKDSGFGTKKKKGLIKLLNVGELLTAINIEVSYASKKAIEKIKEKGGNIKTSKDS